MLRWRLLLGTLLIAGLAGLCWLDARSTIPGLWLMPLALAIAILGSGELIWMMRQRGLEPHAAIVYLANCLPMAIVGWQQWVSWSNPDEGVTMGARIGWTNWISLPSLMLKSSEFSPLSASVPTDAFSTLGMALLASLVWEIVRYRGPGQVTQRLAATALVVAYVGVLTWFVVQLRVAVGLLPLLSLIMVVKMCDIGAYTVGRLIGRHKMTPILSPGKTWEGAIGGVVFGCLAAWIAFVLLPPIFDIDARLAMPLGRPSVWLAYGIIISVAGIFGDLAESLLKRDLGVKDSSSWMPGFGGVLDIMDSILFAAPVAYFYWIRATDYPWTDVLK